MQENDNAESDRQPQEIIDFLRNAGQSGLEQTSITASVAYFLGAVGFFIAFLCLIFSGTGNNTWLILLTASWLSILGGKILSRLTELNYFFRSKDVSEELKQRFIQKKPADQTKSN